MSWGLQQHICTYLHTLEELSLWVWAEHKWAITENFCFSLIVPYFLGLSLDGKCNGGHTQTQGSEQGGHSYKSPVILGIIFGDSLNQNYLWPMKNIFGLLSRSLDVHFLEFEDCLFFFYFMFWLWDYNALQLHHPQPFLTPSFPKAFWALGPLLYSRPTEFKTWTEGWESLYHRALLIYGARYYSLVAP